MKCRETEVWKTNLFRCYSQTGESYLFIFYFHRTLLVSRKNHGHPPQILFIFFTDILNSFYILRIVFSGILISTQLFKMQILGLLVTHILYTYNKYVPRVSGGWRRRSRRTPLESSPSTREVRLCWEWRQKR